MTQTLDPFFIRLCRYEEPTALGHILMPGSFTAPDLPAVPIWGYEGIDPAHMTPIHVGYVESLDLIGDEIYASGVIVPGNFGDDGNGGYTRGLAPSIAGGIWSGVTLINSGVLQDCTIVPLTAGTW